MFQQQKALFLYCVSPVHMGAGTALGLIDNPIQRERHTEYPIFAGSGLKGALRHGLDWPSSAVKTVFGPDVRESAEQAGAVSLGDAQLVVFPVRSPKRGFVYVTSAMALARAARLLTVAGITTNWSLDPVPEGQCRIVNPDLLHNDKVALESFELTVQISPPLRAVSAWLADNALPRSAAYQFFRDKMRDDLVLLTDEDFGYFVRNATLVEPHVSIDDISGTAKDGGLFYTENLPPESLLLAPVMASRERRKDGLSAEQVMDLLVKGNGNGTSGIHDRQIQIGGDATTGRGQVMLTIAGGTEHA
jgi:CRISPR-associated protein Cmr4